MDNKMSSNGCADNKLHLNDQSQHNHTPVQNGNSHSSCATLQSGLVPTCSKHRVPIVFHEPYVEMGYRVLHQPWSYYLQSVFQLHNESMNIWTHLLAFGLTLLKLITFSRDIDFIRDPYTWPLLAGLLCGMMLYACSSAAHCLQGKSELAHYTAFMFDYAGIGLYGLGSVIVHLQYCSEDNFFYSVQSFFVPLGGVIAITICCCCSISKARYKRPYPFVRKLWQMIPVAAIYFLLISPIVHRFYSCFALGEDCNDSIPYHIKQMAWFALSAFFFAGEFPQRHFTPGSCDHFGHSHQLFHIAIMLCTLCQMDGVYIDLNTRRSVLSTRPLPTFMSSFGTVITVLIAQLLWIAAFYKYTKTLVARETTVKAT